MDLITLGFQENDIVYRQLESANHTRCHSFMHSMISTAIAIDQRHVSEDLIKAVNFHAIAGLHAEAGTYRTVPVVVQDTAGEVIYLPPPHDQVPLMMEGFVATLEQLFRRYLRNDLSPIDLATHALWRINAIHPFVNGNGRTARAISYFVLCVSSGAPLPGTQIVPDLIRLPENYSQYLRGLRSANAGNVIPLKQLVAQLVQHQLRS